MSSCPKCGTAIDQDFGIFNCAQCGAMLFINVEGDVQLSEQHENSADNNSLENVDQSTNLQTEDQINNQLESLDNPISFDEFAAGTQPPAEEDEIQNNLDQVDHNIEINMDHLDQPLDLQMQEPAPAQIVTQTLTEALGDVVSYANRDTNLRGVSFDLVLKGLDYADLQEKVKKSLSDPKFAWNAEQRISNIKEGRLELKNLNPAQAVMAIKNLQDLSIQISWSQNVLP
jgi:uncharacterized Zn finger protein (UPF0148 family)